MKNIPEHFTTELDNKLKVVVVPINRGSNVISTNIFYRVGSRDEQLGKSGLAHMLEHLSFKSTKNLKSGEFDKIVKNFGGVNNASTSFDSTHYFIKSTTEHLEKSLNLFAELMSNLKLLDSEFQVERKVVLEERDWRIEGSPFGKIYSELFNLAFIYHPYHWLPIGFADDIKSWTIEDIRDFYNKFYQPQNAILVIAGDIKPETVFKLAKQEFGHIKNSTEKIIRRQFVEPHQKSARRSIIRDENGKNKIDYLMIGFKTPNFEHEDQPALSFISKILAGLESSRLDNKIIKRKELANSVSSSNYQEIDPSLFIISAFGNPNISAEKIEKQIWKELEILKTKKVTQEEFARVQINLKKGLLTSFTSALPTANIFGNFFVKGNIELLLQMEENLKKLTPEKIIEVANKYFKDESSTTIIFKA
jgi:predicted Zn-dependent peptidase